MLSGGLGGNLSVVCGSQFAAKTTSTKILTTTDMFTTRLLKPSSVVSSMELIGSSSYSDVTMSTAAILSEEIISSSSYSDVTMSTADILSEEIDCDHRIGTFFLIYSI